MSTRLKQKCVSPCILSFSVLRISLMFFHWNLSTWFSFLPLFHNRFRSMIIFLLFKWCNQIFWVIVLNCWIHWRGSWRNQKWSRWKCTLRLTTWLSGIWQNEVTWFNTVWYSISNERYILQVSVFTILNHIYVDLVLDLDIFCNYHISFSIFFSISN